MRRFHLGLRRAAKTLNDSKQEAAYIAITRVVEDMDAWGMRVGATEIAAHVFALQWLGRHVEAIDRWRESMERYYNRPDITPGDSADPTGHLFPQTHKYALNAAVALKNAHIVRDIYRQAMLAMGKSREQELGKSNRLSAARALFFWSIFPVRLRKALRQARIAEGADRSADVASDGTGRAWDPARLGSSFLAVIYKDACEWAGTDCKLLSRIMLYLLRALFAEGHKQQAMKLYIFLTEKREKGGRSGRLVRADVGPEILCEMVGGLCRHALPDEAYKLLVCARSEHRNIYAWNAYFDGLANSVGKPQRGKTHAFGAQKALEALRLAISEMEETDGIEPDIVTKSIWLRACFRSECWEAGVQFFRRHYVAMQNDIVCWDTAVRGLLKSSDPAAQKTGWQLIDELVQRVESGSLAIDDRLLETVLLHMLRYLAACTGSAYVPDKALIRRMFLWMEARLPLARQNAFAAVIESLLQAGQIDSALELRNTMVSYSLWPSKSVNCMFVKAMATQNAREGIAKATEFIESKLPRQHYNAAYFVLLKLAAQHRHYGEAWNIIGRHYPGIEVAAAANSPEYLAPFPDAAMYNTALRLTKEHGDQKQHRLLLDRIQEHIDAISCNMPLAARRIAKVYGYYRNRQHIMPLMR
ncbi:hypothetical protein IWW50_002020 [Coemansia erecta]|nr:hypothetical protein IWW50_002020 [Coemansia erecta]